MKQLLILSGKGGTGKTSIASSFIKLGKLRAFADCDVDAPNLDVILDDKNEKIYEDYHGMDKAYINVDDCIDCGDCMRICEFQAIDFDGEEYIVDNYSCEGCSLCEAICPTGAIEMKKHVAGQTMLAKGDTVFSTAKLKMGEGNSGLLVTEVKNKLKNNVDEDVDLAIIDGSPGIGCPVIASISGVDMVLIVTEPSVAGISDLDRIVDTSKRFDLQIGVLINKYDVNLENTAEIEEYCREKGLEIYGKVPFDKNIVKLLNQRKTIVDEESKASLEVEKVYEKIIEELL